MFKISQFWSYEYRISGLFRYLITEEVQWNVLQFKVEEKSTSLQAQSHRSFLESSENFYPTPLNYLWWNMSSWPLWLRLDMWGSECVKWERLDPEKIDHGWPLLIKTAEDITNGSRYCKIITTSAFLWLDQTLNSDLKSGISLSKSQSV